MKKIFFGVIVSLITLFSFKYYVDNKADKLALQASSVLIQKQIKNVGKLVVTEGHFSEVFNYKNSIEIFGDYFTSEKKALVVVNAYVTIAYDLSLIEFKIDEASRTLTILSVPKEEVKISPDLEYYDIQSDFLNPFEADDYNRIKESIKASLINKLEVADLKINAKNRLISELSKFYILTNSLGWTLQYNASEISDMDELQTIKL